MRCCSEWKLVVAGTCAWAAGFGGTVSADIVTTYTDPSAFAGLTLHTFDGEAPPGGIVSNFDITVPGVFMESNGAEIFNVDPAYTDGGGTLGLGVATPLLNANGTDYVASPGLSGPGIETGILIEFDSSAYPTAVGMDVGKLLEASSDNLTITFSFLNASGGSPFSPPSLTVADLVNGYAFRGFSFDEPIEVMEIMLEDFADVSTDTVANALGMDNFYLGSADDLVVVPAPGAATLALIGFAVVGWSWKAESRKSKIESRKSKVES